LFRRFKKPVWTVAGPREPDVVLIVRAGPTDGGNRDDDKERYFIFS
jgi:hypothetical protein